MGLGDWFSKAWDTVKEVTGKVTGSVKSAAKWVGEKVAKAAKTVYKKAEGVATTVYKDVKSGLGAIKSSYDSTVGFLTPLMWGAAGLAAVYLFTQLKQGRP